MDPSDRPPELQRPVQEQSLTAWYSEGNNLSMVKAQDAFQEATTFFQKHLSQDECSWLQDHTSIEDIQAMVQSAKTKYENACGKGKIQKWLAKLSGRIMYYGAVLDTLAQHHPEYVALAWGAFKIIFVGVLNYEELVERIAEALSNIADVLPWTELSLRLYPIPRMKEIASQLYAYIIKFFQQAVAWYKKKTIFKAFSALSKPYELEYKSTVIKIQYYAKVIDNTSSSASRAELRDMHIKLNELTKKFNEMLQIASSTHSLSQLVHHDLGEQKKMIYDLQLFEILKLVSMKHHPQDTLRVCRSILSRRCRTRPDMLNHSAKTIQSLNQWALCENSSLLLVNPGPGAKTKAQGLAATTIETLRCKNMAVLWSLSTGDTTGTGDSTITILKNLISQALQLASTGRYKSPGSLNATSFQVAHTEREWLSLLCMILSCNEETFIIVETEDLFDSVWRHTRFARDFIGLFQTIVERTDWKPSVKILLINYHPSISGSSVQSSRAMTLAVESKNSRLLAVKYGKGRGRGRGRSRGKSEEVF